MIRRLALEPLRWRPTTLEVTGRRLRCTGCGHVWRQDNSAAAERRAKLLRWALGGIACQHPALARFARGPRRLLNTANNAVLSEGRRVLINEPAWFGGVKRVGVD